MQGIAVEEYECTAHVTKTPLPILQGASPMVQSLQEFGEVVLRKLECRCLMSQVHRPLLPLPILRGAFPTVQSLQELGKAVLWKPECSCLMFQAHCTLLSQQEHEGRHAIEWHTRNPGETDRGLVHP